MWGNRTGRRIPNPRKRWLNNAVTRRTDSKSVMKISMLINNLNRATAIARRIFSIAKRAHCKLEVVVLADGSMGESRTGAGTAFSKCVSLFLTLN